MRSRRRDLLAPLAAARSSGDGPLPQPDPPWVAVQPATCRAGWLASDSTDDGSPNFNMTSVADQTGGLAFTQTTSPYLQRLAPPAAPFGRLTAAQTGIARACNASLLTAAQNGDLSFVVRAAPIAGQSSIFGIQQAVPPFGSAYCVFGQTILSYRRYNGTTTWVWSASFPALSTVPHTYGVSVDRVNATTTVAYFYIDGVLVGSSSQTTRDLTLTSSREVIGTLASGTACVGDWRGGATWSSLLSAANQEEADAYFRTI